MSIIFPAEQTGTVTDTPDSIIQDRGINFLFDFNKNEFVLKDGKLIELTGDASVVFWIEKTLRTEYERAPVYQRTEYGFGIERFVGVVLPPKIVKLQFEDNLKKALYQHQRIKNISNFVLEKGDDFVNVSFEVELNAITIIDSDVFDEPDDTFTRLSTIDEINKFLSVRLLTSDKFVFTTSLGNVVYLSV